MPCSECRAVRKHSPRPRAAGADAKAGCAKHAEVHKDGADGKACCTKHAEMKKDSDEGGYCCSHDACEHPDAKDTPAKS